MNRHLPFLTIFSFLLCLSLAAQKNNRTVPQKCGTMPHLEQQLQENAVLRQRFQQKRVEFAKLMANRSFSENARLTGTVYIPVVFHIVLNNPNVVTDAQIQAQLDTLNRDFFGANGDSTKIPSYFKSLFGKSGIQFCLAQRTPDNESTTGIDRVFTSPGSFTIDDKVKHSYSGGIESWNTDKYFNVWVCSLSNGLLGYSTFPEDGSPTEQGVVMDYRSLPGGAFTNFNSGKTLTHETGHYFNLYHIWGDDDGACTGSDDVDDTPNQADATVGCFSGVKTDACTTSGNGIMYQNYMDYSDDPCLVMFTAGQVDRMETALSLYRPSLLSSNGCQPVVLSNYDVQLRSVNQPSQRICSGGFTPQVTIKNRGLQNLTSLQITASIDNGPANTYQWTGSVSTYNTTTVNLNNLTTTPGTHTLTIYVSNPNSNTDEDLTNDTLQISFEYSIPVTEIQEGFEASTFPPAGWDIVNNDNGLTWERVTGIAKTGNASVKMDNFDYDRIEQKDDLRMPLLKIPAGTDSAFLSFQLAAATFSKLTTQGNNWDTLEVLLSTDCGQNYTSVYKKWGPDLITTNVDSTDFIPKSSEWRKDSIDLSSFIGQNSFLVSFRNTTGFEDNIYLDDINLRTVVVNPNLKAQGFLVTPNPTSGAIAVQFYPQPTNLKGIQLFNDLGQKIAEVNVANGQANNQYTFDLSRYAKGMYTVRVVFTDRVLVKKIIKL